jgi:ribosome-associated toxin RatA of RatAB toxin-antitoxin module
MRRRLQFDWNGHWAVGVAVCSIGLVALLLACQVSADTSTDELDANVKARIERDEIVVRSYQESGHEWKTLHGFALVESEPDDILQVLMDFDAYAALTPVVEEVEIIEEEERTAILGVSLQKMAGVVTRYRVRMTLAEDSVRKRLDWEKVEWEEAEHTIRSTVGYWQVEPYAGAPGSSLLTYHVYSDPGPVPLGFGWIVDWMASRNVPPTIENVRARVLAKRRKLAKRAVVGHAPSLE